MFVCDDGNGVVPYTLVCDFHADCGDLSDESCEHPKCEEFTCDNQQCFLNSHKCDGIPHCRDGSDESPCRARRWGFVVIPGISPPALLDYSATGDILKTPMNSSQPCPATHFRCAQNDYCLPVYLRCNGVFDCLSHEDEAHCDTYTCPGFYRCRASSVCVHLLYLCDGWAQCPQHDDELLCDSKCPDGCRCQGLAFVCGRSFPGESYPQLRYLNASGSVMPMQSLRNSIYLVWLQLARCGLTSLTGMHLPNLQFLDLSDNHLTSLHVDLFLPLKHLRTLSLRGNPMVSLVKGNSYLLQRSLQRLDLSFTRLDSLDTSPLASFSALRFLNLSFAHVNNVSSQGFGLVPTLAELDLRGNPVDNFPRNIFNELADLERVYASNYRLCCKEVLPEYFISHYCLAPQDEISSCKDLLRSDLYRAFLWMVAGMSVLGNSASFLFRLLTDGATSRSSFNVLVTNLNVADLLMGVYLAVMGAADSRYRGKYLWNEISWTRSMACHIAGFFSLLSSEVSALIICLITLDRFITLRFPFSRMTLGWWSAMAWSAGAWVLGLSLAATPLLPVTSHWHFYGQTGICIPLPITRKQFAGRQYSFSVMIVLNFVLFVLIALGQASIYWSVRKNALITDSTRKSQDMVVARRLLTVVMSNFLCWFPIGLLGLLASWDVPIPGEVNVGMAIFVLPLNAALNPFLYTINMILERRRKQLEHSLTERLRAQMMDRDKQN